MRMRIRIRIRIIIIIIIKIRRKIITRRGGGEGAQCSAIEPLKAIF